MNPTSRPPLLEHRRLGVTALLLAGLAVPLLTRLSAGPAAEAGTQPVYLAYTVNNIGYLSTCG